MDKEEIKGVMSEVLDEVVSNKMSEIIKAVKEETKADVQIRNSEYNEVKSVVKAERFVAPFVQLGSEMATFVKGVKDLAKGKAATGLNESTDADGGFTVSEEFASAVISYAGMKSVVRKYATVVKMNKLKRKMPKLDQSGSVYGGVAMTWEEEGTTTTPTKPVFAQVILEAFKMIGLTVSTTELLEDSDIDLANYLVNLFGQAVANFEDTAFLKGSGTSQPTGILGVASLVHREVAMQVSYNDLVNLEAAIPASLLPGSVYIVSRGALTYIKKLKDLQGRPLWAPAISASEPATINGYAYELVDNARTAVLGAKGDVLFGNLSAYYIGDRKDLTIAVSSHSKFATDELEWRFTKRVDGKPAINEAFAVLTTPAVS